MDKDNFNLIFSAHIDATMVQEIVKNAIQAQVGRPVSKITVKLKETHHSDYRDLDRWTETKFDGFDVEFEKI